jgi:hypothetical protein
MRTTSLIVLSALLLSVPGCGSGRRTPGPRAPQHGEQRAQPREADRDVGGRSVSDDRPQPPPEFTAGQAQPKPCRVCVKPPSGMHVDRGKPVKLTWTITGTTQPVRVRVHNKNPKAVNVPGGDDQYVTSSGGTPNVVTREVVVLGTGVFQIDATVDERDAIAKIYRAELRRIAAETKAAARQLKAGPRGRRIPTARVLAVLDEAVNDVERSLPFEELPAFRDAVRERADELRREILAASTFASRSDTAAIQLVAQRSGESVPVAARSWLNRFADYLFGAGEVELWSDICVVTLPADGAPFYLYPKSAPNEDSHRSRTRFPIAVGLYTMEILNMTGYIQSKGTVNFLDDPNRIVECTLRSRPGDLHHCDLIEGNPKKRCPK